MRGRRRREERRSGGGKKRERSVFTYHSSLLFSVPIFVFTVYLVYNHERLGPCLAVSAQ